MKLIQKIYHFLEFKQVNDFFESQEVLIFSIKPTTEYWISEATYRIEISKDEEETPAAPYSIYQGWYIAKSEEYIHSDYTLDYDFVRMPTIDDEDWIDIEYKLPKHKSPKRDILSNDAGTPYLVKANNEKGETKIILSFYGYDDVDETKECWRAEDMWLEDKILYEKQKNQILKDKKISELELKQDSDWFRYTEDIWIITHWQPLPEIIRKKIKK